MSSEVTRDWRSTARSVLRWLPGVVITVVAFWLLAQAINWHDFAVSLTSIPLGILALSVVIYLAGLVIRALAWQFLLQRKVPALTAIIVLCEGYFFNNVLPFRIGELARAFLMGRRSRLGMFHVLPTIVVERSYDLVIAAGLLLATLPLALKLDWARPVATLLLVVILAGLFALFLAARQREWVETHVERLAGRWGLVRRWVLPQLHSILNGFSVLTKFEYFAGSFGLLLLSWGLAILRDWVLIRVFVPGAPIWWAALGISASNIVGAVPSVMASLGTYELGAVGALTLVGMAKESVLAYSLIAHVTHLVFSSLVGVFGLSQEGETFSNLYAEIRRAR
ncbi:MAG TPA: lysylphosphatidylglycerol synthase transmembrane domain-containing protein [Anaerolineaceae bacterium]